MTKTQQTIETVKEVKNPLELLRMLKVWVAVVDMVTSCKEHSSPETLRVYQSIKNSETYTQTVRAIKIANGEKFV